MTVRAATAEDAAAIAALWNPLIRDTVVTFTSAEKSAAEVAEMIGNRAAAGYASFVAENAGEVLGFASYSQFRPGMGYARSMEHTVILAPAAQGRGLGRALLELVEGHARAAGAQVMIAGVSAANPDGLRFHAACGYAPGPVLQAVGWKFGKFHDLHLMQKYL